MELNNQPPYRLNLIARLRGQLGRCTTSLPTIPKGLEITER